jgi:hypothetical protein
LFKFSDSLIPQRILSAPIPVQLICSIVLFFQVLYFFRLLFNFSRWFFPCQELTTQTGFWRNTAKYVFSTVVAASIGTIAYNLISMTVLKLLN